MSLRGTRSFTLASRLDALGSVRADARAVALEHGFDAQAAEDFALCVHEAVSNAIVHGNREDPSLLVEVRIEPEGAALRATVSNSGPGFDPAATLAPARDHEQPRGRGMRIIRSLTDEYAWLDGGRKLTFLKRP